MTAPPAPKLLDREPTEAMEQGAVDAAQAFALTTDPPSADIKYVDIWRAMWDDASESTGTISLRDMLAQKNNLLSAQGYELTRLRDECAKLRRCVEAADVMRKATALTGDDLATADCAYDTARAALGV